MQASLEDIAFVVAGHLLASLRFRAPNGFNASRLVKVKSIAAAATVQTNSKAQDAGVQIQWLAGTLCRKHLSHKQMARQVANPRILLFACGISYDRSAGAGRLNSLDTLLEQERSYMSILVDKITALEPDVIFVERTVSRHAQELLRARRVGIVLNVKYAILERISRHTGAALLASVDHVDKARADEVVGTCRSFYVKTIPVVPDDEAKDESASDAIAGAGGKPPMRLNGPRGLGRLVPSALTSSRAKTETYLYIDGCDPLNGCTVLLTGPSKRELRVFKHLTRRVLFLTYRALLEAHVLSELNLHGHAFSRSGSCDTKHTDDMTSDAATGDTTWYTTCTLRVRESSSTAIRYHPCTGCKYFGIDAYSDEDISVGNFLTQEMAALLLKCQVRCCCEEVTRTTATRRLTMWVCLLPYARAPSAATRWPTTSRRSAAAPARSPSRLKSCRSSAASRSPSPLVRRTTRSTQQSLLLGAPATPVNQRRSSSRAARRS